jgi:hypothetical protein
MPWEEFIHMWEISVIGVIATTGKSKKTHDFNPY